MANTTHFTFLIIDFHRSRDWLSTRFSNMFGLTAFTTWFMVLLSAHEALMHFFAFFDSHFAVFYLALLLITKPVATAKRRNWKALSAFDLSITFFCFLNASPGIVDFTCHHRYHLAFRRRQ